ncbi:hypothetical protein LSAT2_012382, partial [Lamellibrachia satsuma]
EYDCEDCSTNTAFPCATLDTKGRCGAPLQPSPVPPWTRRVAAVRLYSLPLCHHGHEGSLRSASTAFPCATLDTNGRCGAPLQPSPVSPWTRRVAAERLYSLPLCHPGHEGSLRSASTAFPCATLDTKGRCGAPLQPSPVPPWTRRAAAERLYSLPLCHPGHEGPLRSASTAFPCATLDTKGRCGAPLQPNLTQSNHFAWKGRRVVGLTESGFTSQQHIEFIQHTITRISKLLNAPFTTGEGQHKVTQRKRLVCSTVRNLTLTVTQDWGKFVSTIATFELEMGPIPPTVGHNFEAVANR